MAKMTPEEFAQRLDAAVRALPKYFGKAARRIYDAIAQRSTSDYMRDADLTYPGRTGTEARRRRPDDTGPLRIVSSATLRATLNQPGAGGIERTKITGLRTELAKGVSLREAPGGYNEDRVAVSGRDLSFLAPAAEDAQPDIEAIARDVAAQTLREALA